MARTRGDLTPMYTLAIGAAESAVGPHYIEDELMQIHVPLWIDCTGRSDLPSSLQVGLVHGLTAREVPQSLQWAWEDLNF